MPTHRFIKSLTVVTAVILCTAFIPIPAKQFAKINLPYSKAGLSKQQAAAHLLNRFSFGATPGEIDAVVAMGLEQWLQQQMLASMPEDEVNKRLSVGYEALALTNEQTVNTYVRPDQLLLIAAKKGLANRDSVKLAANTPEYRSQIKFLMDSLGLKPMTELHKQLVNQKVIRAAYSNNQLQEVLTDFWFNHFNVSLTKNQSQQFVLTYERDAIRPNVLSSFSKLLEATAKHPAILAYLDNALSVSNDNNLGNPRLAALAQQRLNKQMDDMEQDSTKKNQAKLMKQIANAKKNEGLNENYAREIMELHTLGVDGGYTQQDVTEVARAFTGWTIYPISDYGGGSNQRKLLERVGVSTLEKRGFIFQDDFMFRADKHDAKEKNILGEKFNAGGGYDEGMRVLSVLSSHPSTAAFICKKIATRFVTDTPSTDLLKKMTATYISSKGDIKSILLTMVEHVDFWKSATKHDKVKSPFELVISAVRATHADVKDPFQVFNWSTKMGQRFYYYQAPTGFPDKATYWINTGSLLSRMNFGLAFATQKIPGVQLNWAQLNNNHEPESIENALTVFSAILLPERNQSENIQRLLPLVKDVNIGAKITAAAQQNTSSEMVSTDMLQMEEPKRLNARASKSQERKALSKKTRQVLEMPYTAGTNSPIAQVAGIIIGSPEFQRK
ncbi:MAG: DUF1800 domain-containing protein [Sediminibacterium sp.]|nr:DUF1800 domain-containing protein [Sediminibacterium sp.]TXT34313.1 MAG: hypothetical protein FD136_396 [Chitinophagaceae bacterium]